MNDVLEKLQVLDKLFNYQMRAKGAAPWFKTIAGSRPVLVSAPHACMHRRDGVQKMQEEYTGAIARYLAEECHCHAIFTCCQTDEDPNWQPQGQYKHAVQSLVEQYNIAFLIDLHGMTNKHKMGVAIGTINGFSCDPQLVLPHFVSAGFKSIDLESIELDDTHPARRVVVDHPKFTGGVVNQTVTRFACEQLQIESVQIELASEVRVVESAATSDWPHDYRGNPEAIIATITALKSMVERFP